MAGRVRLTREQLSTFFDRICLKEANRVFDTRPLTNGKKLEYLNLLIKHQLVKVPWENLSQHYSWHYTVNVRPAFLFRKITENPGRGGYCFEVNYLFHMVLFSLNFDVYMAGSRIHLGFERGYTGFEHMVNIITIGQKAYLQDCGAGSKGPTFALPLKPDASYAQVAPAQCRLRYDCIADNVTSQKLWILDYRQNEEDEFKPLHCFVDFEFTPTDILGLNLKPGTQRQSWFTYTVVAVRYTTTRELLANPGSADETALEGDIDGIISIFKDTLRWWRKGEKELELRFATEAERVQALQKYFGICLDEEEQQSILGTAGMIVPRASGTE